MTKIKIGMNNIGSSTKTKITSKKRFTLSCVLVINILSLLGIKNVYRNF